MSANIWGSLKAAAGEFANAMSTWHWAQQLSQTTDELVDLIQLLTCGGLLPATGLTTGARPLSGYVTALLQTGAEVFVEGVNQTYYFDAASTLPADQFNIVSAVGTGRFIRQDAVLTQFDWYVDTGAGDDSNAGTIGAPLKTGKALSAQFQQRIIPANQQVRIFWTGDQAANDYVFLDTIRAPGATIFFHGTVTGS